MKNLNVIQIRGFRGIVMAALIGCCLVAGFIVFPGWVLKNIWNYAATLYYIPTIGLFQGTLLWGIIAGSYFTFRKNKVVVCFKSPEGLNEEELKSVFEDIKKQSENDPVLKAMMKARELELKNIQDTLNKDKKIETEDEKEEVLVGDNNTK